METFKKVDLMSSIDDVGSGAFDAVAMNEDGVNNMQLSSYIAQQISPVARNVGAYLKDGCGFGVVFDGDNVTIIGLEPTQGTET